MLPLLSHLPPRFQQKLIGPGVIRAFGQLGGSKCLVEFLVQAQTPGVDFGPGMRELRTTNFECRIHEPELRAVFFDATVMATSWFASSSSRANSCKAAGGNLAMPSCEISRSISSQKPDSSASSSTVPNFAMKSELDHIQGELLGALFQWFTHSGIRHSHFKIRNSQGSDWL